MAEQAGKVTINTTDFDQQQSALMMKCPLPFTD